MYQAKPIKSIIMDMQIIKPYISQTNIHKKESLRVASLSKLVDSNSVFDTKCAEFSKKW